MEAHSKQRGQLPRMHESGELKYGGKGQRVLPVPLIGENCNLWCPRWDSKDLGGRPEQGPEGTSRPGQIHEVQSGAEKVTSEEQFQSIFVSCNVHITIMAVYIVTYLDSGFQGETQNVVGPSAWNDLPVELRSLLITSPSKFYISLKSWLGWEYLWVVVSWRGAI